MDTKKLRMAQGRRLAAVRKAAGFKSARTAALECGWAESSYRAHENGSRTISQIDAMRYISRFRTAGVKGFTAQWLLFGDDRSLDDLIKDQPPDVVQRAYEAVLAEIDKN